MANDPPSTSPIDASPQVMPIAISSETAVYPLTPEAPYVDYFLDGRVTRLTIRAVQSPAGTLRGERTGWSYPAQVLLLPAVAIDLARKSRLDCGIRRKIAGFSCTKKCLHTFQVCSPFFLSENPRAFAPRCTHPTEVFGLVIVVLAFPVVLYMTAVGFK